MEKSTSQPSRIVATVFYALIAVTALAVLGVLIRFIEGKLNAEQAGTIVWLIGIIAVLLALPFLQWLPRYIDTMKMGGTEIKFRQLEQKVKSNEEEIRDLLLERANQRGLLGGSKRGKKSIVDERRSVDA